MWLKVLIFESHRIAFNITARCVLWAHKLRLFCPHHLLIRLRLNGYSIFFLGLRSNRRDWLAIDNRCIVGSFLLADFQLQIEIFMRYLSRALESLEIARWS